MDITTGLGIILGAILIFILGVGVDKLGLFWDPPSVAIVLGGTVAALLGSYPFNMLTTMFKHIKIVFFGKGYPTKQLIDTLEEMAQLARKNGLLALEEKANEIDDPFFKEGIMMIVDATEAEAVRATLENELDIMSERHEELAGMYEKGAAFAPSFGMIGTLVGLVKMLYEMGKEGFDIGPAMATALITTFYGCILANLIFNPIAKKLRIRNDDEVLYKQIMIEGILAIQAGDNPKVLKEKLATFLSNAQRAKVLADEGGGGEGEGKKGKKGKKEKAEK